MRGWARSGVVFVCVVCRVFLCFFVCVFRVCVRERENEERKALRCYEEEEECLEKSKGSVVVEGEREEEKEEFEVEVEVAGPASSSSSPTQRNATSRFHPSESERTAVDIKPGSDKSTSASVFLGGGFRVGVGIRFFFWRSRASERRRYTQEN